MKGTTSGTRMLLPALFILVFTSSLTASPPNILFIVADDMGWADVQWRDSSMYTPNLEQLKAEGVELTNAYAQPSCTPSRAAFLTGIYPFRMGIQNSVFEELENISVPLDKKMLPQSLKELGYATHMVGKWHLGFCRWDMTPTRRGFDSFYGMYNGYADYFTHTEHRDGYDLVFNDTPVWSANGTYSTHLFTQRTIDILKTHNRSQPLFIYLAYQAVHGPHQVPEHYVSNFCADVTASEDRKLLCGMGAAMDEGIGNITRVLEELGYMDNLLIFFTSDNGGPVHTGSSNWPLRGSKLTLWEGGTKVTSFLYSSSLLRGNTSYDGLVHAVDWYPTLLRLAGAKKNIPNIDGLDLWESISTNGVSPRQEFVYDINDDKQRAALRYKNYKMTWNKPGHPDGWYNPPPGVAQPPEWNYTSEYMLFDLDTDPTETTDISSRRQVKKVYKHMKSKLDSLRLTMPPQLHPPKLKEGDPTNWGGAWTPGWC
ncbi:arylsulfatase J-like isoform X2 [Pomacea canaliculata]|uniref:arylsulfatase J-like isoform X2 n=1 Tax=Pomacea canaliculata TaxID=400727 RepID=UPI000D73FB46|nr:arylsulfatase J-like isoform X2 [Pomacea canaliculata]